MKVLGAVPMLSNKTNSHSQPVTTGSGIFTWKKAETKQRFCVQDVQEIKKCKTTREGYYF